MLVGAGISVAPVAESAALEAAGLAAEGLAGASCRLAVVFVTGAFADRLQEVGEAVAAGLAPQVMVGAAAQGVVGPRTEVEEGAGVSVWAAAFDEGEVRPFRSWALPARGGEVAVVGWPDTAADDVTLLLADPHTYPAGEVVGHLGRGRPGHRVVGGLMTPGAPPAALLLGSEVHREGAVGVVVHGIDVDTVVSQGCRPVGEPLVVTRAEGNVVHELGGAPAAERLRELFAGVTEQDRLLMRHGLQLGLVADEYREEFTTGDFLIRAVLGADPDSGAIAVGDVVDVGRTVQFQVRDAASAHDDLAALLADGAHPAAGALLFTCNGRGQRMFGAPGHDVSLVEEALRARVAGAFCAGEVGPVGARSYLHGFTASLAVFRGRQRGSRP